MKKLKRNIFVLLFSFMLLVIFSACGADESEETTVDDSEELSDQLFFFNWGHNIDPDILEDFEEEFGVEVVYDTFSSNEEMLTKMGSGVASYDIVIPTDYYIEKMIAEDLLHELNMDNIPNFENIQADLQDPEFDPGNKYTVPYLYGSTGIAYNTKKMDTPTSWNDMWDSEFYGHTALQTSSRSVFTMVFQAMGMDADDRATPSDEQLAEAQEYLRDLAVNLHSYENEPAAKLINEEVWIAQAYSDQAGIAMDENPDIDYVLPEDDGGFLWMDNFAIPKDSKNKYTAEVFINYMLEAEVSKKLTDFIPSSNPNAAAIELMSEEDQENRASYPDLPEDAEYYRYSDPEYLDAMTKALNELKTD